MSKSIILLDPSVANFKGDPSLNLGDLIIQRSIHRELMDVFGSHHCFKNLTTHQPYSSDHYRQANECAIRFVCGTNLLSSKRTKYTWYREEHRLNWLFPKLKRVVLFGVGWGVGYPEWKQWHIKAFYHRNLHRQHLHSVRDSFSDKMLKGIGIKNVTNTSCPTLWQLEGFVSNPKEVPRNCLFTLTDYRQNPERDDLFLRTLTDFFPDRLYFFPQGARDIAYLESLPSYQSCRDRNIVLSRSVDELDSFLTRHTNEVIYIGTRLHGGVFAMQHGIKALIIGVDHRAVEICRDVDLSVIVDSIPSSIESWLNGNLFFSPIKLPLENIRLWREYWADFESKWAKRFA